MSEEKSENIVKKVCRELGLTYRELGERIGVAEGTIKQNAVKENVTEQLTKALELLLENKELKVEVEKTKQLKETLKDLLR